MESWMLDVSKVLISGIVISVVTSIFTVRLSIRRFHEEKWWEHKTNMYSKLFETLHNIMSCLDKLYEDELNTKRLSEIKRNECCVELSSFLHEYEKLHSLASFQLSRESVAIIDDYEKNKIAYAREANSTFEHIDGDLAAVKECLEKLKKAAKRDLKVK